MEFSSLMWSVPFLGIIFSMSLLPLICPKFWHKYGSAVPFFWISIYLFFVEYAFGFPKIFCAIFEPLANHYVSFIVLISALYITAGGVFLDFPRKQQSPFFNTAFLFFGSLLSGWIGTTGASTLLIRPLLRANANRICKTHIVLFFIFLISNIGGAATPLGDPPLFIGFQEGVDFFWFLKALYKYTIPTTVVLCVIFFAVDCFLLSKEKHIETETEEEKENSGFIIEGHKNIFLIFGILLAIIFCDFNGTFSIFGKAFKHASIMRNIIIAAIAFISIKITPEKMREKNHFSFDPIKEIAELFVGIFITVTPVICILDQGVNGEMKFIFDWMAPMGEFIASRCFWVSGMLSSVLDNAPTFLIFFHMISGNAAEMMAEKSRLLVSISISTVFMGALTYIGNAPNLMVRSIARNYGVSPPSFVGYIGWSALILCPIFYIVARFI